MSAVLRYINFDELLNFLKDNKTKRFLITFHSMGDRDGVGSAIALLKYLSNSVLATPDFITRNAKTMLEEIGYKTQIPSMFPKNVQSVIILDTNNLESVGAFRDKIISSNLPILFIDHHTQPNIKNLNALIFNDEEYNSTASIMYETLKKLNFGIDKDSAVALLHGIISDSSEFHNATSLTFRQVADLLEATDVTYTEIMSSFMEKVPVMNRYSLIKDICSSKIEITSNYLIIFGACSIHANLAAEMAIKLGADASLFWKEEEKEVSISGRLRPPLDKKLSIHLGKMMQSISSLLDGNGGGHACAAGAYGPNKNMTDVVINKLLEELRDKFKHG